MTLQEEHLIKYLLVRFSGKMELAKKDREAFLGHECLDAYHFHQGRAAAFDDVCLYLNDLLLKGR
jgi:hypothetical protein